MCERESGWKSTKFFGLFSQNKLKTLSVKVRVLFQHSQLNNNSEQSKKTELSILKSKDPKGFLQENLRTVSKSFTLANKAIRVV